MAKKKQRIIAVDTDILIIHAGGQSAIPNGRARAKKMLEDHEARGDVIYVPAPALAECCYSVDEELLSRLRVAPLNGPAWSCR